MRELEILKARTKLATVKYELRRSMEQSSRFIALIRQMGILDGYDVKALWTQVESMEPSPNMKQSLSAVELWTARLAEAKGKVRSFSHKKAKTE